MRETSGAYDGQSLAARQQHTTKSRARALVSLVVLGISAAWAEDDVPFTVLEDTLIVSAARAFESDDGTAMVLEGGLELHANDWRIVADRAVLAGRLDDPDKVVVDGDPARIIVGASDGGEALEGRGQHLEFEPNTETIRLEGAAMIVRGEQSISSESIKYLLDKGTFAAGSHGRVRVVMKRAR